MKKIKNVFFIIILFNFLIIFSFNSVFSAGTHGEELKVDHDDKSLTAQIVKDGDTISAYWTVKDETDGKNIITNESKNKLSMNLKGIENHTIYIIANYMIQGETYNISQRINLGGDNAEGISDNVLAQNVIYKYFNVNFSDMNVTEATKAYAAAQEVLNKVKTEEIKLNDQQNKAIENIKKESNKRINDLGYKIKEENNTIKLIDSNGNTIKTFNIEGATEDVVDYDIKYNDISGNEAIYKLPERNPGNEANSSETSLDDMMNDADAFLNQSEGEDVLNNTSLQNFSRTFYNIMLTVGIVVAVIVGAILGIKIMTSGVGEKAEYKKALLIYLVGCVVVFGGFAIWKIVVTILQNM